MDEEAVVPDTGRVIIHFDVDAMYAQAEEVRNPSLRGRPLGVTQKYLIVTCNYPARSHGVTKLMGVAEAQRRCPHIVLVSGEDLTPYRAASKQILAVLKRYGTAEKLGLDEIFVDATPEAQRRLAALARSGCELPAWQGHVHLSGTELVQDSRHRPMDLRAVAAGQAPAAGGAAASCGAAGAGGSGGNSWEALLRIGSVIAAEARAAVRSEAGYRTSAGVACNKTLAKLCSGLHKPDDQTVLPPPEGAAFVAPLPVRALPGVGYKMEQALTAAGLATAADLRALTRHQLMQRFGERSGAFLHAACRGKDPSPVQERGPPKSVTVEDSFKTCRGLAAVEKDSRRRPATLTVAAIAAAALGLLRRSLLEPFDLSLINLGATAFSEGPAGAGAAAGTRNIAEMFAAGRTAAAGAAAAAAATAGVSEAASQEPPAAQAAPSPQNQPATMLAYSRAAAEASAQQRRSYSTAPLQAPLLSKRAERQLREQSAQLLQQQQAHGPPPASPQALQQQPHHGSFGFGFDGQHDEEGDDASMWADLQDLAAWRSDSGRRHSPKLAAAGLAGGEVRCDVGLAQQQGAVAAPPAGSVAVQQGKQEPGEAGEQEAGAPQAKQARLPLASKPATYRNAEALAIQELFFYGGSSKERASLELALQLQQEEVQAAAAARKRDVPPAGGAGRQHKQRRGGRGPLDAFFSCKG
ncbi:hypothetical protein CHLNCDRAFT_138846 [Chlorella variabilis]|uniref:UmuC domain-containing protein n=1 Tax=Chlorella variabilis TaxID=554065 RepID=E1ZP63_CHLVA|nr:hypothetical protein CHLNCDRAFT_138846 [Chlorella variabilis]EFN52390.1 hypothetical protein CHLNCDRAFT_138846 [Chlorella variabilis]|eukprot:XP_005844492.1 hypothetical protein CHLNCDRAFT_138846 [Chlorella variabilis]